MDISKSLGVLAWLGVLVAPWTARADLALGPFLPNPAWPVSSGFPVSSTFGPRMTSSGYEFHRGIDIQVPYGTPLYAVAGGVVRIAGSYPSYENPLIQLKHYKPNSNGSCSNRGCYYTNYLHISSAVVSVGQTVNQGDLIGYSGESALGYDHVHFEVRDGGTWRKDCVHPLALLPFNDVSTPSVVITAVDTSMLPLHLVVTGQITLPPAELDLNRVEVDVFDTSTGQIILSDSFAYDMNEWNRLYSPTDDPDVYMCDPNFNGVTVSPSHFNASTPSYDISFTFNDLAGDTDPVFLVVQMRAIDVAGHASEVYYP